MSSRKYHKNTKRSNKPLLGQLLDLIPGHILKGNVLEQQSDKHCSTYKTYDQLVSTMFGQLNKCSSYREISLGLNGDVKILEDLGLSQSPARSSMSDGNAKRNHKVFRQIYNDLITYYGDIFSKRSEYKTIKAIEGKSVKLVDATLMSVCLKLFPWAKYRTAKGGIKAHVSLDEKTMLPELINITEAKVSDRRGADGFRYPKDTIVVDDRGYFDFKLFRQRIDDGNIFVTRLKSNTQTTHIQELELPEDKDFHILKDEKIKLDSITARDSGISDQELRKVSVYFEETNRKTGKVSSKVIELITNEMEWEAAVIAELYKRRWYIETFFKLMKQNLQIKNFLSTSEQGCKSQIYIALICYFLLELVRRTAQGTRHRFGHFVTVIRVCLLKYDLLEYLVNDISTIVRKVKPKKHKDDGQQVLTFSSG